MMMPTVHLNGTPRQHFYEQYEEANLALEQAIRAMLGAQPNARDYPQGLSAYEQARTEFNARVDSLVNARWYIQNLWEHTQQTGESK